MVDIALDAIGRDELTKVVLARSVVVETDTPPSVTDVLTHLRAHQPGCFLYHADGLVGATPSCWSAAWGGASSRARSLGPRRSTPTPRRRLRASAKDTWEHRLVVDDVVATLDPVCEVLAVPAETSLTTLASVLHLATPVHGTLARAASALTLARALHPTAAVAGTPRDAGTGYSPSSRRPRGRYPGRSDGSTPGATASGPWRCAASIDGCRAMLHAGAGIVAGSRS